MKVLTTVEAQLQELRDPQVRDLGWACFSQALCALQRITANNDFEATTQQSLFEATPARLDWLRALDQQPTDLHKHLAQRHGRRRLGIYFEHLIEFFVTNDPVLELAARNVAVRDGGHTLGEFDFLYYDVSTTRPGDLVHLEVAVKFYLGLPSTLRGGQSYRWRGPGSHDAFEIKLAKMITQQSRLSEHARAQTALSELGLGLPTVQRIAIAGELFQPLAHHAISLPKECLTEHHWANWCYLTDIDQMLGKHRRALLLDKSQWLTPVSTDHLLKHADPLEAAKAQLYRHFESSDFPIMIELANDTESDRVFVVPDSWPAAGIERGKAK